MNVLSKFHLTNFVQRREVHWPYLNDKNSIYTKTKNPTPSNEMLWVVISQF